ncbi:MAG: hypothetical protein M3R59_07765 [Verrucomicrobiota bacterium]|nr:hypothetical protein [Verrucomicrobiota bacterium]
MPRNVLSLGSIFAASALALFLSACETAPTRVAANRALPAYEPPMARATRQQVRTTAYTHTEADHLQYTNHNALGGILHSATVPRRRTAGVGAPAVNVAARPLPRESISFVRLVKKTTKAKKTSKHKKPEPPRIGSAAADWGRWPAGTTFRIISTGQVYRVEDYGWALAGRNTIDLYVENRGDMNRWGARTEPIEILKWGDPAESLERLRPHIVHKHIQRMVDELEGNFAAAAALQ